MLLPNSCSCWMKRPVQYDPSSLQESRERKIWIDLKRWTERERERERERETDFKLDLLWLTTLSVSVCTCKRWCVSYSISRVLFQPYSVNSRAGLPQSFFDTAAIEEDVLLSRVAVVVTENLEDIYRKRNGALQGYIKYPHWNYPELFSDKEDYIWNAFSLEKNGWSKPWVKLASSTQLTTLEHQMHV